MHNPKQLPLKFVLCPDCPPKIDFLACSPPKNVAGHVPLLDLGFGALT